jgi:exonuclease SbcC
MRLVAVELEEFRGWVRPESVDLDATVVVLQGPNGTGKTSLFDAILWALTGELPRLGEEHKHAVVSLYGESGHARVRLELRSVAGDPLTLTRSTDGERARLQVEFLDATYSDDEAALVLLRELWPNGVGSAEAGGMAAALSRSVYLQQDDVRRFIEADSDAERFAAVAELVGAGRYTEIQHQLERERSTWSRQTNEAREEAAKANARVAQLSAQVDSLSTEVGSPVAWEQWRDAARSQLGDVSALPDEVAAPQVAESVDSTVKRLEQALRAHRRNGERVAQVRRELDALEAITAPSPDELTEVRSSAERADAEVAQLQEQLALAEHEAAAERDRLVQRQADQRDLQTLATLALRHLGQRCPVCDQAYDRNATRERLRAFVEADASLSASAVRDRVRELSEQLRAADSSRSRVRVQLRDAERMSADRTEAEATVNSAVRELGFGSEQPADITSDALAKLEERESRATAQLQSLIREGESLALQLAQAAEISRRADLVESLEAAREDLQRKLAAIEARESTTNLANRVVDGLRSASDELVSQRVASLAPVLDRVYARIDPHPSFRTVQLISRTWHGRGRLQARIADDASGVHSEAPQVVLSSSQLNALALSVFLALNLSVPNPPLDAVLLDDPLQSLDEVNLLGVVDLLRRFKASRQLLISTHDRRFAALLQRKLRSTTPSEALAIVRLSDWGRVGPSVQEVVGGSEESPWKIVAHA